MVYEALVIRGLMVLTMGLGVALGALGFFIISHFATRRAVAYDVGRSTARADVSYEDPQRREAGRKKNKLANDTARCTSTRRTSISSTISDAGTSAFGSSEYDDDFYSCHDNLSETGDSELATLLCEVDELVKGEAEHKRTALYLLEQNYDQYRYEDEVLWRLAQASFAVSTTVEGNEKKKAIIQKGCEYAEQAVNLNPRSSEAHKWYAINAGCRGNLSHIDERISGGRLFKKHIDEALKLKPNEDTLHYILGRFKITIASLPWLQRKMATTALNLSSVSIQDALDHFMKAERLASKPWKENRIFIAQCHEALGNVMETVEWLQKADDVENIAAGDEEAEETFRNLSTKYASHLRNRKKWN